MLRGCLGAIFMACLRACLEMFLWPFKGLFGVVFMVRLELFLWPI